jgi:hypothetical protein
MFLSIMNRDCMAKTILGRMLDARDHVTIVSFSSFILTFSLLPQEVLQKDSFFFANVSQLITPFFFHFKEWHSMSNISIEV